MNFIRQLMTRTMLLALAVLLPSTAHATWSQDDGVYYLRTMDGLDEPFTVNGSITFKSQSGTTIPSYRDCGVVFVPANAGEVITVKIEEIDLEGSNYLLAYDGAIGKVGSGTSDGKEQSTYLPAGWVKKFTAANAGETYTSTSPDGKLSFGFHSGSANSQKGFTITVTSMSLKDMEYGSAFTETVAAPWRGKRNAEIAILNVNMDGGGNPLTLNNATFDLSQLNAAEFKGVRVYRGKVGATPLATAKDGAATLSVSDLVLNSGDNRLIIVADLPADFTGTIPAVPVTALTVDGTSRSVANNAETTKILPYVLIGTDHVTYTVGDAIDFYDDGGKDGKISENFSGMVTFVPATADQKVKVDFSKLDLFNTSSTGKNDILTVYNGRDDSAPLLATLLTETRFVKSTAEDGSLTVKLVSTTGIPKDGFEAVVTQYLPGNMTFSSVTGSNPGTATVSAGQKDVALAAFDILTDNNASPLKLTGINGTCNLPAAFKNVRVYAFGEKPGTDISKATLVAGPADGSAALALAANCELIEGHNNFTVVADMADDLLNDAQLTLGVSGVKIGDADHTVEGATGTVTIANTYSSVPGTHEVILYDAWDFLPTYNPSVTYAKKYNIGTTDEVTVFVPAEKGAVAEINFSSFNCGSSAKFAVYSGREAKAENMLWEMNSGNRTTGPAGRLRSTAADGTLTVVFNPNTEYSYSTEAGWEATVKPFVNHAMTVTGVEASRPVASALAAGASGERMLDFSLVTEGNLTQKKIEAISLSIDGADAVSAVSVYSSTTGSREDAVLFGTVQNPGAEAKVTGSALLTEGNNWFFVEADIKEDAAVDTNVRIGVTSVTDADNVTDALTGGNPEGGRLVKYIIVLSAGEHLMTISSPMTWYDDGGAEGKISSRIAATYIFVPKEEGYAITLDASQFSIGNGHIYVYSGRKADEAASLGSVTGYSTTNGPKALVSTAADGSMTVTVSGPSGSTLEGFTMTVGLHKKIDYTLSGVTAAAAADANVLRGNSDAPLMIVKTTVEGDKGDNKIGGISVDLSGCTAAADIKAAHLYYMGDLSKFNAALARPVASVDNPQGTVTFEGDVDLTRNGDHYFAVTADIDGNAAVGNTVSARLAGIAFNGAPVSELPADAFTRTVRGGLKGTFTVGGNNADYATFAAAATALAGGIEGPVTFEVADGTYAENIAFTGAPGACETSPVIVRSASGNADAVILTGKYSSSANEAIVSVKDTPWLTLEGITVAAGSQSFKNGIFVKEDCPHFTLRDCTVTADMATDYSGINLFHNYVSINEAGHNNDYMTIENCRLTGGRYALYLGGTSYVALPKETGLVVRGNTVSDAGRTGIYIYAEDNATVTGNTVTHSAAPKNYSGLELTRLRFASVVSHNRIVSTGSNDNNGIYLRDGVYGTVDTPVRVFNNDVILNGAASVYARVFFASNDIRNVEVAYNTMRVSGSEAYLLSTTGKYNPQNVFVHDNILANACTKTATVDKFWNETDIDGYQLKRNALQGTVDKIVTKDDSNFAAAPQFASETNSRLASCEGLNVGLPCSFVTDDIDGNARPATALTVGAYEYVPLSQDAPAMVEGYPTVSAITTASATLNTRWNMACRQYALAVEMSTGEETAIAEAIKAGKSIDASADVNATVVLGNLKSSTAYRIFILAVSDAGVESEIVATEPFSTARVIPTLTVTDQDLEEIPVINAGEKVTLDAGAAGGDAPLSYVWTAQDGTQAGTTASLTVSPAVSTRYKVTVTSADGQTASTLRNVEVYGDNAIADFEDIALADGADLFPAEAEGRFYSGSFAFDYGAMPESNFWYGFTPGNETEKDFDGLEHQFRSAPGGAFDGNNFAVAYPQGQGIVVTNNADGVVIPGVYLANSAYAYSSMLNGDEYAQPFASGSWFKVTVKGTKADGTSSSLDYYLGDYRSANEADRYISDKWEWVDLRSLGAVTRLDFSFDGSEKGSYGLNTPTYVCIDRLGALPADLEAQAITVGSDGYDLSSLFDHAAGVTEVYRLHANDNIDASVEGLNISVDGSTLKMTAPVQARATRNVSEPVEFIVTMTAAGHSQHALVHATYDSTIGVEGIAAAEGTDISYAAGNLRVTTDATSYDIEVFSTAGLRVAHHAGLNGTTTVSLAGLPQGVYIVRAVGATKRIVIR